MSTSLLEMAKAKDFSGVLAEHRERPVAEVLEAAEHLREDDIYNVAIELYRWLLDREETSVASFGIGQCYGKIYDYEAAATHLGRAFELDPDRTAGATYYAYILERLDRLDDAAGWYERGLAGDDADDLWSRSHHAWFLEKWGKPDEAVAAFQEVLGRNPAYTWAVKRYALLLRSLGRREEAEAVIAGPASSASLFARLNLLEYRLIDEDDPGYEKVRAEVDPSAGPPWHRTVVELFDIYRDVLLPNRPDPARMAAWEAQAAVLTDSVHRDFDDLSALLALRGGDVETWKGMVQQLLK
jgi:tetratricopeptide (TPR) repeat protein